MQYLVLFWIIFASFSLQAKNVVPEKVNTDYQKHLLNAHENFTTKNYQTALKLYEQSFALSPLDSTLYNIAICQFKLKQWPAALATFKLLSNNQVDSDLIEYNIAIVHKKLGNQDKANNRFTYLSQHAQDSKIVMLANKQLGKDTDTTTSRAEPYEEDGMWQSLISVQLGNDSNIVLPDDENITEQSDQFADFLFSTSYFSRADLSNAWLLDFTYYGSKYSEATNYEISMYAISGRKYFSPTSLSNTKFYMGADFESIDLSNVSYLDTTSFNLGVEYPFSSKDKLSLDMSFRNASATDSQFKYLAGSSSRYQLTWKHATTNGYWKLGSKYQIDDKNDRFEDDEFISYSADRVSLFTSRYWRYQQWDFTLSGQYRLSEYHDKNTYGGESDTLREDDRLSLFANLTYHVNDNLSLHTEIDISNNTSTHEENEYDQNTLSLGATWQFN